MRVILKFTATLLVGICAILTVAALLAWQREVAFFETDMRLDHRVVAEAMALQVARVWNEQGRGAALEVPAGIREGERQLVFDWIDPAAGETAALPASARQRVLGGETVSVRDRTFQHTFVPIRGPGDDLVVLDVREPMAEERAFSSESLLWSAGVALVVVLLCSALTLVLGVWWVGRPIRALCAGAERIGSGELDVELPVRGRDEIAQLAQAMTDMSRSLARARDRVRAETERRVAAIEQLRHADRLATVGTLAAGVAHELGTPLNVVWAQAGMVANGELAGEEVPAAARSIAEQAERMTGIIRQLLDFARPRPPDRVAADLSSVAARAVRLLQPMAEGRGVAIELEASTGPLTARVDPVQIQQVLTNLVVNALQATARGGRVAIRLAPAPNGGGGDAAGWCRIEVADNGAGIAPEHLDRLFEPFFTTKGVGEGTGLGLSVSRGMVIENGGRIEVASEIGRGSCFTVLLPGAAT